MAKTTFLEYFKIILSKVSFDSYLLTKEYWKAVNNISKKEKEELDQWIEQKGLAVKLVRVKNTESF